MSSSAPWYDVPVSYPTSDSTTLVVTRQLDGVHLRHLANGGGVISEGQVSYPEYEALRRQNPMWGLEALKPPGEIWSDTCKGNTIGCIVGEAPASLVKASEANPPIEEPTYLDQARELALASIDDYVARNKYSFGAKVDGAVATAMVNVFLPENYWEVAPIGLGLKVLKSGVRVVRGTKRADDARDANRAQDAQKGGGGGQVRGPKPKGPCDHLRRGKGNGPYRGGAHSDTTKPAGDGLESHHMPADKVSPLARNDGMAIQMEPAHHGKTGSNGSSFEAMDYRSEIARLLDAGKWNSAMAMEILDVRRVARKTANNSRLYNEAISEMLEYFKCLKFHGLLPGPN